MNELINARADRKAMNRHGQGALHVAVFKDSVEVVEALIEAKFDIDL